MPRLDQLIQHTPEAERLRAERLAQVLEWRALGVPMPEIAKRLGVTRQQAYRILRQAEMR